jgi:hypothetical protein
MVVRSAGSSELIEFGPATRSVGAPDPKGGDSAFFSPAVPLQHRRYDRMLTLDEYPEMVSRLDGRC